MPAASSSGPPRSSLAASVSLMFVTLLLATLFLTLPQTSASYETSSGSW